MSIGIQNFVINKEMLKSISKCQKCKTNSNLRFFFESESQDSNWIRLKIIDYGIIRAYIKCLACDINGPNFYFADNEIDTDKFLIDIIKRWNSQAAKKEAEDKRLQLEQAAKDKWAEIEKQEREKSLKKAHEKADKENDS